MHLLTAITLKNPSWLFRTGVILAQAMYVSFFWVAYIISPRFTHRLVGYLEEEAVKTYTHCIEVGGGRGGVREGWGGVGKGGGGVGKGREGRGGEGERFVKLGTGEAGGWTKVSRTNKKCILSLLNCVELYRFAFHCSEETSIHQFVV